MAPLKFLSDFIGNGMQRTRTLHPDQGADPKVVLDGGLATNLQMAIPSCYFTTLMPASKLLTLPLSVVLLVLGRLAVLHGSDLGEEPFAAWFCDLPTPGGVA